MPSHGPSWRKITLSLPLLWIIFLNSKKGRKLHDSGEKGNFAACGEKKRKEKKIVDYQELKRLAPRNNFLPRKENGSENLHVGVCFSLEEGLIGCRID